MKVIQFIKNNKVGFICMLLYVILTLPAVLGHIPLFDEAHAWRLAEYLNFSNYTQIIKTEGHPILWFLILAPFSKFNLFYPYPMMLINYLSCLGALFLVWYKAPFGKILKAIITFSAMFLLYLPITLRSYSLGVLILFLLCVLYKKQLQHYILYVVLIGLSINLNVMSAIGGIWFGVLYLYNLFKNRDISKKNKIFAVLILSLFVLAAIPLLFASNPTAELMRTMFCPKNLFLFFSKPAYYLLISYVLILAYLFVKVQSKISKCFLVYSNLMMISIFVFVYPGFYHHFIFFFVYLIVFMWIADDEVIKNDKNHILAILLGLFILPPINKNFELENILHQDNYLKSPKTLINFINNSDEFSNSHLYIHGRDSYLVPYLRKDIKIYDICNLQEIPLLLDFAKPDACQIDIEPKIADKDKNVFILSRDYYLGEKILEFENYSLVKINKYKDK